MLHLEIVRTIKILIVFDHIQAILSALVDLQSFAVANFSIEIAMSTMEAEYIAMSITCHELLLPFMKSLQGRSNNIFYKTL